MVSVVSAPARARLVTASEFAALMPDVSIHLVAWWRNTGKVAVAGRRGRSPVYRLDDLLAVESATRASANSHRKATAAA